LVSSNFVPRLYHSCELKVLCWGFVWVIGCVVWALCTESKTIESQAIGHNMGGICSRSWKGTVDGVAVDNALSGSSRHANGHANSEAGMAYQSIGPPRSIDSNSNVLPDDDDLDKHQRESFSFTGLENVSYGSMADDINDGIPRLSRALSHKSKSKQAAVKLSYLSHVWSFYSSRLD